MLRACMLHIHGIRRMKKRHTDTLNTHRHMRSFPSHSKSSNNKWLACSAFNWLPLSFGFISITITTTIILHTSSSSTYTATTTSTTTEPHAQQKTHRSTYNIQYMIYTDTLSVSMMCVWPVRVCRQHKITETYAQDIRPAQTNAVHNTYGVEEMGRQNNEQTRWTRANRKTNYCHHYFLTIIVSFFYHIPSIFLETMLRVLGNKLVDNSSLVLCSWLVYRYCKSALCWASKNIGSLSILWTEIHFQSR